MLIPAIPTNSALIRDQVDRSSVLSSPYYQDSHVTIINADCRDVMARLPRGLVVTDPPYNIGYHYDGYKDNLTAEEYQELIRVACPSPCVLIHYAEDLCAVSWTLEEIPQKMVAWVYPSNTARQWRGIGWWGCKPDFKKDGQAYRNPNDKRIKERIARGERARRYDWWETNRPPPLIATQKSCWLLLPERDGSRGTSGIAGRGGASWTCGMAAAGAGLGLPSGCDGRNNDRLDYKNLQDVLHGNSRRSQEMPPLPPLPKPALDVCFSPSIRGCHRPTSDAHAFRLFHVVDRCRV